MEGARRGEWELKRLTLLRRLKRFMGRSLVPLTMLHDAIDPCALRVHILITTSASVRVDQC